MELQRGEELRFGRNAIADRDDRFHIVLAQAVDLPHAETQREVIGATAREAGSSVQSHRL